MVYEGCDKKIAKDACEKEWQRDWETSEQAIWTKKLIKNLCQWRNRKHGEINYHLTQLFTGHGIFRNYLKRFAVAETENCWYCEETDSPDHTFFKCRTSVNARRDLNTKMGQEINADNIVENMLKSKTNWSEIETYVTTILKKKIAKQKEMQQ